MPVNALATPTRAHRLPQMIIRAAAVMVALCCALAVKAQDAPQEWYEIETGHQGLPVASPGEIDRSAPRQTLRGFMDAIRRSNTTLAAHYLNLSEIPPDHHAEVAPEIAAQLASIIERHVWVDWTSLPARPDAMVETLADSHPLSGQPRRDLLIATLDAKGSAYDIRLARFKPPDEPAIWLFTPQTIENVGVLYDRYGPRPYESHIPEGLKREFAGLWLWEWVALPVMAAFLLLLGAATRKTTLWLAGSVDRPWLRAGLERSGTPLAILLMAGATQMLLRWVLAFSGPVQSLLRPALTILIVLGIGVTALRLVDALLNRITLRYVGEIDDKRGTDERDLYTSIYALRRLIVLLMLGLAGIIVLVRLNLFDTVGMTLLASAGVLTVIFGIAGQAILGNILASLQIAFAKPVRIGDSVMFEGDWAYVEAIFYTFLRLRTWDRRRIVVPVTYFVSNPFENWSVAEARMMKVIELWLDYRADVDYLRNYFEKLLRSDPEITEPDNSFTYATEQSSDGQKISFYAMMPDPSTGWEIQSRLREELMAHIRDTRPEWLPRSRVQDVDGNAEAGRGRDQSVTRFGVQE